MRNSTIIPKQKQCKCGCGKSGYIWSKGMIKECYYKINKPKPIAKVSIKKMAEISDDKELLNQWFKEREKDIIDAGRLCWECGKKIHTYYYRHATAHIFPKSLFPSVALNEHNWLCLCASNGCHSKFDSSLDNAKEMKVWKEAVDRYQNFKHLIKENHKYKNIFEELIT